MLDADHFKVLNDRHGHQVDDECLRLIAGCLLGSSDADEKGWAASPLTCPLPTGALAARMGGEEFAMVLPGMSAESAISIAEDLRGRIGAVERGSD